MKRNNIQKYINGINKRLLCGNTVSVVLYEPSRGIYHYLMKFDFKDNHCLMISEPNRPFTSSFDYSLPLISDLDINYGNSLFIENQHECYGMNLNQLKSHYGL